MSGKMFLAYFMKGDKLIDESLGGHEIYVFEEDDNSYKEMLTGLEFERNKYDNNNELTVLLCQRVDPNIRYKDIAKYKFFHDEKDIYNLIGRVNSLTLSKHK